jgi:hypothetical protein
MPAAWPVHAWSVFAFLPPAHAIRFGDDVQAEDACGASRSRQRRNTVLNGCSNAIHRSRSIAVTQIGVVVTLCVSVESQQCAVAPIDIDVAPISGLLSLPRLTKGTDELPMDVRFIALGSFGNDRRPGSGAGRDDDQRIDQRDNAIRH